MPWQQQQTAWAAPRASGQPFAAHQGPALASGALAGPSLLTLHLLLHQGIDLIAGGRNKKTARTAPKSDNVYLKLLVKVGRRRALRRLPAAADAICARPPCLPAHLTALHRSCTASW